VDGFLYPDENGLGGSRREGGVGVYARSDVGLFIVTTQPCRCERTSAKQSPVERVTLIEKYAPLKRRLLRREERPPRNDMISEMAEQLLFISELFLNQMQKLTERNL